MCGDTTAFEQACRSQDMRAHAHGREASGMACKRPHRYHHRRRYDGAHASLRIDLDRARHHEGVDPTGGEVGECRIGQYTHTGRSHDGRKRRSRQHHLVARRLVEVRTGFVHGIGLSLGLEDGQRDATI